MKTNMKTISEQIASTEEGLQAWHQERAIFETTERICELLGEAKLTRSQFAEALGKSKGYVTQLLDGQTNMTLRTISDAFLALGRSVHITDSPATIDNDLPVIHRYQGEAIWDSEDVSDVSIVVRLEM